MIASTPTTSRIHPSATSSTKLMSNCTTPRTRMRPITTKTMPSPIPMLSPCLPRPGWVVPECADVRLRTSDTPGRGGSFTLQRQMGSPPIRVGGPCHVVRAGSEGGLVEVHQAEIRGLGDRALCCDLREHGGGEEGCGRHLALVERLVLGTDLAAQP